jgi:hypothetical protein
MDPGTGFCGFLRVSLSSASDLGCEKALIHRNEDDAAEGRELPVTRYQGPVAKSALVVQWSSGQVNQKRGRGFKDSRSRVADEARCTSNDVRCSSDGLRFAAYGVRMRTPLDTRGGRGKLHVSDNIVWYGMSIGGLL